MNGKRDAARVYHMRNIFKVNIGILHIVKAGLSSRVLWVYQRITAVVIDHGKNISPTPCLPAFLRTPLVALQQKNLFIFYDFYLD